MLVLFDILLALIVSMYRVISDRDVRAGTARWNGSVSKEKPPRENSRRLFGH